MTIVIVPFSTSTVPCPLKFGAFHQVSVLPSKSGTALPMGGGGPAWNKDRHGLHTYYTEILSWIQRARV